MIKEKRTFIVYGEPYGKKNMQPMFLGKRATLYNPKQNVNYMSQVQYAYLESYRGEKPLEGQIEMEIIAYKSIPSSFSKKKTIAAEQGIIKPTSKPDCDNISKAICDALQKNICFKDDSQVCSLRVEKRYSATPRVEITISSTIIEKTDY